MRLASLLLGIGFSFSVQAVALAARLTLAVNGRSDYAIISSRQAAAPERFAAQELQKYVRLISGAELPIMDHPRATKTIWVGQIAGGADALKGRGEDSYLIRIAAGNISLAGASPRATLYSVYRFLEKHLGCGWIAPGDDYVPRANEITILDSDEDLESPAFTYRAISLFPYADGQLNDRLRGDTLFPYALMQVTKDRIDWAAKNRLNWVHPCLNEGGPGLWEKVHSRREIVPEIVKRGLGLHYGGHSYFAWVPPDKYYKEHPEYYSTIQDGKPQSLNIANPEVAEVMAGNIGEFLNQNPEISIVTVWMNDRPAICTTPECLQMEGPLHLSVSQSPGAYPPTISFSNAAVKFANEVARRLRQTHPKVLINHLAYIELIDAPTGVTPEPNVLVAFAPIQRAPFKLGAVGGYFRPLNDADNRVNREYLSEIRKWLSWSKNFYVWDYYSLWWTLGTNRPRWQFPILETMAADLRFYRHELGLSRVSSEIADWHEENMYVYARLAWNPDSPWRDTLEDFCRRSYGRAAEPMIRHWLALEAAKENWFRRREECERYLQQAFEAAETMDIRRRLGRIALLWQESECQKEGDPVGPCKK